MHFTKMHGAGNDFIIINNIHNIFIITNIWWITNNNIILIINIRKNVTLYKINISIINFIILLV